MAMIISICTYIIYLYLTKYLFIFAQHLYFDISQCYIPVCIHTLPLFVIRGILAAWLGAKWQPEILRENQVELGSLSHYLQGFLYIHQ